MTSYSFFEIDTWQRMAGCKGHIHAMINNDTGDITAFQTFGLLNCYEKYCLNINDDINLFAHTLKDRIILKAKETVKQQEEHKQNEALKAIDTGEEM